MGSGATDPESNQLEGHLEYIRRCYADRVRPEASIEFAVQVRKPLFGLIKSLERKRDQEQ